MNQKTYRAFISYSHADEKQASWLQKKLESYTIPAQIRKAYGEIIPKHLRPVFRDKTDLRPGNLGKLISSELDDSGYLIVVCSEASKQSTWVNREIEHFRQAGNADRIIPVVTGCKQQRDITDCYPAALDKSNQLGISLHTLGKTRTLLSIIATILDIRFDDLYKRHQKAQKKKLVLLVLLSLLILLIASAPAREIFRLWQQQQALTSAASVTQHIASSLMQSNSPTVEERMTNLNNTWVAEGNNENNVIFPLERRREKSKIFTGDLRRELDAAFVMEHLLPGGKESFREKIGRLNSQNDRSTQAIISSAEFIIKHRKNALAELKEIEDSRSLQDAQRHIGYFESELQMMRLYGMTLFWQLHQTLKPLADDGHPEAQLALALASSIPFDQQTVLDKIEASLGQKKRLINNAKTGLETAKLRLSAGYDKIRRTCEPLPDDPPEQVWGKMMRLVALGLIPEALSNLDYYEKMMKKKRDDPSAYTVPARVFIKEYLHKAEEGGVVVFGFEGNRHHGSLKTGDIITAVDGRRILFADDFIAARKAAKTNAPELAIYRHNRQTGRLEPISVRLSPNDPKVGMMDLVEKL
ncbi:hypothetical protein BIU88_11130 [Chlorobaculum limnaeum]|uniref:TIR domain-containing protein n=1 Tax=Chlorobaculum limnaeum TaxID=274537 RepID=A0A1D8D5N3_CHLLM|nr:TIR domain-containing protein [Chlorobaculum limnaeum]AOS84637.1 hypothetical protein BIU88_11130 [Chlorobaculum limnaeum]